MSNEQLRAQAQRTAPEIKIAAGIWIMGMMIIAVITVVWVVLAVWSMTITQAAKRSETPPEPGQDCFRT